MKIKPAHKWVRAILVGLDRENSELVEVAHQAGMRWFGETEIFPNFSDSFRLLLCQARTMLLDRPFPLVHCRRLKRNVQDVEAYISWLLDPDRKYMPVSDILIVLQDWCGRRQVRSAQGAASKEADPEFQRCACRRRLRAD